MVPDPDGPGFNYLCDPAVMEPGSRCRDADLENGVVRSDIRCVGNHFWRPLAQLTDPACALINRNLVRPLALASAFKADSKEHEPNRQRLGDKFFDSAIDAGRCVIPSHLGHSAGKMRFLRYQMHLQWFCWKKMRLGVIDWAITLRLWNMNRLVFCVGFATAKTSRFFEPPLYEESPRY